MTRIFFLISLLGISQTIGAPISLVLPTDNDALFDSGGYDFYMYTNRYFEGVRSKPWVGGSWGFVRNQKRTKEGVIYTKFHEGIDIKPVKRRADGSPADLIYSVMDGKVVYVNSNPRLSNYGRYIVIEHHWGDGPIYSLYAHLAQTKVSAGENVKQKQAIALMGYSGVGLNKERAHLHFEMGLMLNPYFDTWYSKHLVGTNQHGKFSGLNLTGFDTPSLFLALRENPNLTLYEFIRETPIYYTVLIPNGRSIPILKSYPWLSEGSLEEAQSIEVAFSRSGFPISFRPNNRKTSSPQIVQIRPCLSRHENFTIGRVSGTGKVGNLTARGKRYVELIYNTFP